MKISVYLLSTILLVGMTSLYAAPKNPPQEPSTSAVYRFAGFSEETELGTVGFKKLYERCQIDLGDPLARMCSSEEVMASVDFSVLPETGGVYEGWVNPKVGAAWWANSSHVYDVNGVESNNGLSCQGWGSNTLGMLVRYDASTDKLVLGSGSCTVPHYVTCCTPQ